jgi:hypothetical protein
MIENALQIHIIGFVSFEIIFHGSLTPADFLNDATFLLIFRVCIALFFEISINDVTIGGFFHYPSHNPWIMLQSFGQNRRLRDGSEITDSMLFDHGRALATDTGLSVQIDIATAHIGQADSTSSVLDALFGANSAEMLQDFYSKYMSLYSAKHIFMRH